MLNKPGLVISIQGKDKSVVEVQYESEIIKAKNMLPHLEIGDYVVVLNGIVIQILDLKDAEKFV